MRLARSTTVDTSKDSQGTETLPCTEQRVADAHQEETPNVGRAWESPDGTLSFAEAFKTREREHKSSAKGWRAPTAASILSLGGVDTGTPSSLSKGRIEVDQATTTELDGCNGMRQRQWARSP